MEKMKAKIFSNGKETVRYEEKEKEKIIRIESIIELSHYFIPFVRLLRFVRKYDKEKQKGIEDTEVRDIEVSEEKEDKPLKLSIGPFKFNLN